MCKEEKTISKESKMKEILLKYPKYEKYDTIKLLPIINNNSKKKSQKVIPYEEYTNEEIDFCELYAPCISVLKKLLGNDSNKNKNISTTIMQQVNENEITIRIETPKIKFMNININDIEQYIEENKNVSVHELIYTDNNPKCRYFMDLDEACDLTELNYLLKEFMKPILSQYQVEPKFIFVKNSHKEAYHIYGNFICDKNTAKQITSCVLQKTNIKADLLVYKNNSSLRCMNTIKYNKEGILFNHIYKCEQFILLNDKNSDLIELPTNIGLSNVYTYGNNIEYNYNLQAIFKYFNVNPT